MSTFHIGGVHPHDNKRYSLHKNIVEVPLPSKAIIPLVQHIGAPAEPIVQKGDRVLVGQLLAEAKGFVSANVHSPYSGVIDKIDVTTDAWGMKMPAIYMTIEGDEWLDTIDKSPAILRDCKLSPEQIVEKIRQSGIVGLGGACFPTHVKLTIPDGKKADVLIINGVECEPYLTCDHQLMLEHGAEIVIGVQILSKALKVNRAIIGIEKNKKDAIEHMKMLSGRVLGVEVMPLDVKYPQGGEKQLIDACVKRQIPSGKLPIDVGVVVDNVATVFAIYEAVQKNKPLISRVVSVTGKNVQKPGNYLTRFGVPISDVIEFAGGCPADTGKIVGGGPMMGKAFQNLSMPCNKRVSSVLFFSTDESRRHKISPCIKCGACVEACPMGLEPYLLSRLSELERYEEVEAHNVMDCIDCGSCHFTCPAHRPLLDYIRYGKSKVGSIIRARAAK